MTHKRAGNWAAAVVVCCTHLRRGRCWRCGLMRANAAMLSFGRQMRELGRAAAGAAQAFQPVAMSPGEAEWVTARRFQEQQIARAFGVPAHMLRGGMLPAGRLGQAVLVVCCTHMEVQLLVQGSVFQGSMAVVQRRCSGCREERRAYTCTPAYQGRAELRRWFDRVAQAVRGEC